MKIIAVIGVIGVILLELSGAVPKGSVGGAMALALAHLAAGVAIGLYEAWTMKRGALGWIVNIVVTFVGGVVAAFVVSMFIDPLMGILAPLLRLEGSLMSTRHPLLYVLLAVMTLITVAGAWLALKIVNRFR